MTKERLPKPPAWALTHNRELWTHFDPIFDPSMVVDWSLARNYRVAEQMQPGDRVIFWMTGDDGGVARIGFVISLDLTTVDSWTDANGKEHKNGYGGLFFLPPFPQGTYIARSAIEETDAFRASELAKPGVRSSAPPLRVEQDLLDVILGLAGELGESLWPTGLSRGFPDHFDDPED